MNGFACCDSQNPGTLFQSADTTLNFTLYQSNSNGPNSCVPVPFNLTSATEIEILFPTLVNPPVILKYTMSQVTITNAQFGQFSALMSSANADLLALGLINIEIRVTIAGVISVCQLIGQLNVVASLFPSY